MIPGYVFFFCALFIHGYCCFWSEMMSCLNIVTY